MVGFLGPHGAQSPQIEPIGRPNFLVEHDLLGKALSPDQVRRRLPDRAPGCESNARVPLPVRWPTANFLRQPACDRTARCNRIFGHRAGEAAKLSATPASATLIWPAS